MLSWAGMQLTARCKAVARVCRRYSVSEASTTLSRSLCEGRRSDVLKVRDFARYVGPAAGVSMVHASYVLLFLCWVRVGS
jgi:hypothetical protein